MKKKLIKKSKKLAAKVLKLGKKFGITLERAVAALIARKEIGVLESFPPSSLSGWYNFSNSKNFCKVVIRNKIFFEEERANIELLCKIFPKVVNLTPIYNDKKLFNLIWIRKAESMDEIKDDKRQYVVAAEMLKFLREFAKKESFNLERMPFVEKGLKALDQVLGVEVFKKFRKFSEEFLHRNSFSVGLCHGDFHSKNFISSAEKNYLIDFDCVRLKSLQELDAIYFVVQKIIDDMPGIWWHEALILLKSNLVPGQKYYDFLLQFVDINQILQLMVIYFLDRLGQDLKYFSGREELPKNEIIKLVECFSLDALQPLI